jgi:hypothetical protein
MDKIYAILIDDQTTEETFDSIKDAEQWAKENDQIFDPEYDVVVVELKPIEKLSFGLHIEPVNK